LKIECDTCGAIIKYDLIGGEIIFQEFASEMKEKCPEVKARGGQTGEAEFWKCSFLTNQIQGR
jgi:transcription initiation factor TFIIIB Brf1 subunit/transcription initiation factor TFIIB